MGNGKGNVEYYVAVVKPGRMMIEVGGMSTEEATRALKMAQYKFAIKTKIVTRRGAGVGE
jgi:large subunit ribosomal protein L16